MAVQVASNRRSAAGTRHVGEWDGSAGAGSLLIAAERGGGSDPSRFGRVQHAWGPWTPVTEGEVDEELAERSCVLCGVDQVVADDCLGARAPTGDGLPSCAPARAEAA